MQSNRILNRTDTSKRSLPPLKYGCLYQPSPPVGAGHARDRLATGEPVVYQNGRQHFLRLHWPAYGEPVAGMASSYREKLVARVRAITEFLLLPLAFQNTLTHFDVPGFAKTYDQRGKLALRHERLQLFAICTLLGL